MQEAERLIHEVMTNEAYKLVKRKLAKQNLKIFNRTVVQEIEKFNMLNLEQDWVRCVTGDLKSFLDATEVNRAIYNLPPRLGKTTILTTFGCAYLLGSRKNFKICIVNANKKKLDEINEEIKSIVNTEMFQETFDVVDIASKNTIRLMRLSNGSTIEFKVSGSAVIGSGYNLIIFDDYMNPNELNSEAKMMTAIRHLESFLGRKEYSPATKFIIIEQRIGFNDTTAICKKRWDEGGIPYKHISLPYEITDDLITNGLLFKAGTYLDVRFSAQGKKEIMADRNGTSGLWETQYQQNPTSDNLSYIKREYIEYYDFNVEQKARDGYFSQLIISCDTACKTRSYNDFSAFVAIGYKEGKCYILDVMQEKYTAPDLYIKIADFYFKWAQYSRPTLLIEDKASGTGLIQQIKKDKLLNRQTGIKEMPIIIPTLPKYTKEDRLMGVKGEFEGNNVFLPRTAPWLINFENELFNFPNTRHDDQVDALVHGLAYLQGRQKITSDMFRLI